MSGTLSLLAIYTFRVEGINYTSTLKPSIDSNQRMLRTQPAEEKPQEREEKEKEEDETGSSRRIHEVLD
jgi:hypothetical protein